MSLSVFGTSVKSSDKYATTHGFLSEKNITVSSIFSISASKSSLKTTFRFFFKIVKTKTCYSAVLHSWRNLIGPNSRLLSHAGFPFPSCAVSLKHRTIYYF